MFIAEYEKGFYDTAKVCSHLPHTHIDGQLNPKSVLHLSRNDYLMMVIE